MSRKQKKAKHTSATGKVAEPTPLATPSLTPSTSAASSLGSAPHTPPEALTNELQNTDPLSKLANFSSDGHDSLDDDLLKIPKEVPPKFTRRASHDLFECIEQSKHKRLSENQARYVFAQVVEAVYYLDSQGITHCDIKDENLVIDSELKVRYVMSMSTNVSCTNADVI